MPFLAQQVANLKEQRAQVIGILGVLSIFLSLFLVKEHYETDQSFCDNLAGGMFSCSSVNRSEYSEFIGVPVAVFGAIWGLVLTYGAWKIYRNDMVAYYTTAVLLWSLLGVFFIFYMVAAEIILGAVSSTCTSITN
jgi:uncharacterized membrane protein